MSREVVARRVGHVRDLLDRMGDPEHEGARERVDAALSVVASVERRVGAGSGGSDRSDSG
ncbi:hypothetical protein BRD00_06145 [Halobacteriales archaeon QS_8_69_26]|nr:MAG: hypothetical protein BRD00_06145 [Halobacteriales archaeon QS_8_69_26]